MSGRNARELAREFQISRQLNPDVERAVYHVALSAAKSDLIDDDQWCEIAAKYMELRGFECNQFATYRHNDTDNDHIHIAASRILLDTGKVVHDSWDYVRSEKVLRGLEKEYGLTPVIGSREKLARRVSTGQTRRMMREQSEFESGSSATPPELPIKVKLQQAIDEAVQDFPPMPLMIARLQLQGIEVRAGFTRTGLSLGISFQMQDQAFSGTHLGAGYTFNGITQRTEYEQQRDDPRIQQLVSNPNLAYQMQSRWLEQQRRQQQLAQQQRKS